MPKIGTPKDENETDKCRLAIEVRRFDDSLSDNGEVVIEEAADAVFRGAVVKKVEYHPMGGFDDVNFAESGGGDLAYHVLPPTDVLDFHTLEDFMRHLSYEYAHLHHDKFEVDVDGSRDAVSYVRGEERRLSEKAYWEQFGSGLHITCNIDGESKRNTLSETIIDIALRKAHPSDKILDALSELFYNKKVQFVIEGRRLRIRLLQADSEGDMEAFVEEPRIKFYNIWQIGSALGSGGIGVENILVRIGGLE